MVKNNNMEILILLFTIFYATLAWRKLAWATAFVIAFLPVYQIRFALFGLPLTLLEVMIFVLFTVWFVQGLKNKEIPLFWKLSAQGGPASGWKNIKNYPFWKEIIAVLVIAFISMLIAGASNASLGILKAYFIEPIMFFIVFVNIYKLKENREKIFWALAFSAFIISAVAIYQKITGQLIPVEFVNSGRVTGVFPYPNAVGLYLGPIIMLMVGWLLSLRSASWRRSNPVSLRLFNPRGIATAFGLAMTVILSLMSIYFAGSEGALIGIIVAGIIFGLLHDKLSRRAVIAILILGAVVLSINSGIRQDVYQKVTLQDLDGQIRKQLWRETWQMLNSSPVNFIFGAGLANYQQAIAPYHQSGIYIRNDDPEFDKMVQISLEYQQKVWQPLEIYLYPHNLFLNFWSELGLVGMLLFIWIIAKFFMVGFQLIKQQVTRYELCVVSLLCAMIVLVIHGLVDAPYFKNDLAVLFWVLIGMLGVLNIEKKEHSH